MALDWLLQPILLLVFFTFIIQFKLTFSSPESAALLKLKTSFINPIPLSSWVSGSSPCKEWVGIICYNGAVTGLRLENMGLEGKIDVDALVEIPGLRTISFAQNAFSGTIPEFNRLGYLKAMYLSGNQFSGKIPPDFFAKMDALKKVWLSDNRFTGEIPSSLSQLSHLLELHLENNEFSGKIPPIYQPTLMSFNVSNNNLQGEIPRDLERFNVSSFEGNVGLCAEDFGKLCNSRFEASLAASSSSDGASNENGIPTEGEAGTNITRTVTGVITLTVMLLSVAAVVIIKIRQKGEKFDTLGKDNGADDEVEAVEVQVSMPIRQKELEQPTKMTGGGSNRNGSSSHGKGGSFGEIVVMNREKGSFGMIDLMKAAAEILGNGGLGSSYKVLMANGLSVVVKRIREMNAMGKDGFDAEIRRLGKLRHPNILTPLAFHYRKDEKLLIYEYVPKGSLLHLLHGDDAQPHAALDWPARLKIVKGIAKGLHYLHTELPAHDLPHGNLKSSNVFIGAGNEPMLSEFGFSPLINPLIGAQTQFAYRAPEAAQYEVSPKCDVYCLGLLILEILTGKSPTQHASNVKGGTETVQWMESLIYQGRESELLDPEIARTTNSIGKMKKLLLVGAACVESNPKRRLDMRDALHRIEDIQLKDASPAADRTIQVLPSLRDGYADAAQMNASRPGQESGSFPNRNGYSDGDHF